MVKLSYGDCWQQKPASSFATLLLNELNSVVARFTTQESNLSCNKSGCWKLQILTSDWIKLCGSKAIHGSYVTYWDKTGLPWAGKTRNIHSSKLSQLANNLFRRKACMYVASKTRNIDRFSTRLQQCWKKAARSCCKFYRTFNNRTKTATKSIAVILLRTCDPARSCPLPTIPIKHLIAGC